MTFQPRKCRTLWNVDDVGGGADLQIGDQRRRPELRPAEHFGYRALTPAVAEIYFRYGPAQGYTDRADRRRQR